MELDKPGHTRVEVRCIVRTEGRPCHHGTSNYRRVTENLCSCRRFCWGVDKIFSADTRGNNKDEKRRNPGTVFVPAVGQKAPEVIPIDNAHQLRTLSPQKDTCLSTRSEIAGIKGTKLTDEEGDHRDDHNPNANKVCKTHGCVVALLTAHVQLILAMLARAWPPSMLFKIQKPMLLMSESKLGTMAP